MCLKTFYENVEYIFILSSKIYLGISLFGHYLYKKIQF